MKIKCLVVCTKTLYLCTIMKVIKSVYEDSKGLFWLIEKITMPTKRGGKRTQYIAECESKNVAFKGNLKRDVFEQIEQYHNKQKS